MGLAKRVERGPSCNLQRTMKAQGGVFRKDATSRAKKDVKKDRGSYWPNRVRWLICRTQKTGELTKRMVTTVNSMRVLPWLTAS